MGSYHGDGHSGDGSSIDGISRESRRGNRVGIGCSSL